MIANSDTFITQLPIAPIWHPPVVPKYDVFAEGFKSLTKEQPADSMITRVFQWDVVAFELTLWAWLVTVLIGGLYIVTRGTYVDPLLHVVLYIAIGLTTSACVCVGLWLLVGGWGPPVPLFFAICGLIFGAIAGAARLRRVAR